MPSARRVERISSRDLIPRASSIPKFAACLLACLVGLLGAQLLAQAVASQFAQVEGVVRDGEGKLVADASVILQRTGASESILVKTSAVGSFGFQSLPSGTYVVRVEKAGFSDVTSDVVTLSPAKKKRCEFVLQRDRSPVASRGGIELDDKPSFTVAGMSDSTGSGGHGSETRMRTGEVLARETARLEDRGAATTGELSKARASIENQLNEKKAGAEAGELYRRIADIDEKLNDPLAAEHEYERASQLDPSEPNYFAWGAELLLHGAAAPAIEVFGNGVRLHPDSARMLSGLGAALYTSGSVEDAAERLCRASDLEPANPAPYLFLGKVQEVSPVPLRCVEERLGRFAAQEPANALANYYNAIAIWKAERGAENSSALDQAEAMLKKATALDPKFDAAFCKLGNLQFSRGLFPDAIAAYKKAIEINPSGADAHYRLGLAYKRIGQDDKSQVEIETYKKLDEAEAAKIARQRRELGQFLFVLKGQPSTARP